MSGPNTLTVELEDARRFNANGSQKISDDQAEAIENNKFLRSIISEVDHAKTISVENISRLRKVFSNLKTFNGIDKYLYEVTISLGMSRKPELIALAREFNTILTARH